MMHLFLTLKTSEKPFQWEWKICPVFKRQTLPTIYCGRCEEKFDKKILSPNFGEKWRADREQGGAQPLFAAAEIQKLKIPKN